jgi:hypothetical protein
MFSMTWFGLGPSDPQRAGPDIYSSHWNCWQPRSLVLILCYRHWKKKIVVIVAMHIWIFKSHHGIYKIHQLMSKFLIKHTQIFSRNSWISWCANEILFSITFRIIRTIYYTLMIQEFLDILSTRWRNLNIIFETSLVKNTFLHYVYWRKSCFSVLYCLRNKHTQQSKLLLTSPLF